jgi:hypothetical protein
MACPTFNRGEVAEGNGTYSVCECIISPSFKVNGMPFKVKLILIYLPTSSLQLIKDSLVSDIGTGAHSRRHKYLCSSK